MSYTIVTYDLERSTAPNYDEYLWKNGFYEAKITSIKYEPDREKEIFWRIRYYVPSVNQIFTDFITGNFLKENGEIKPSFILGKLNEVFKVTGFKGGYTPHGEFIGFNNQLVSPEDITNHMETFLEHKAINKDVYIYIYNNMYKDKRYTNVYSIIKPNTPEGKAQLMNRVKYAIDNEKIKPVEVVIPKEEATEITEESDDFIVNGMPRF